MTIRKFGLLIAGVAALTAASASAEQYPGWYGGVDLGYRTGIDRSIIISDAECARRGGRIDTASPGGARCTIPRFPLRAAGPEGHKVEGLGDIGWLITDELEARLTPACRAEGGWVVTSGLYRYCRMPHAAVRR